MALEPRRLHELPPIDPRTVAVVRASCARLPGDLITLSEEFYRQLFTMAPHLRPMFPADMTPQTEKLLTALLGAVQSLDRPDQVEPVLRRMGASHRRRHGVTNDMYVYVGHALVRAIGSLSGHLESSVGSAWIAVYEWLAAAMIAGAEEGAAAASAHEAPTARPAPVVRTTPGTGRPTSPTEVTPPEVPVPAEVTVARHAETAGGYPLRSARRVSSRPG